MQGNPILSHGAARPVRVVLADEQELMREGLAALLSQQDRFEVVGTTGDGRDCLRLCVDRKPDLLVFNENMPGLNGIEAARRVASRCPQTRMLCLSESADRPCVRAAFDAGAHGYVLKRCTFANLVDGIDSVLSSRYHVSPELAHVLVEAFCQGHDPASALTPREKEVAQLYAEGHSTRQIAERLHISMKTVGTHREHILAKLELEGIADLTRYALRTGLIALDA
ncbi:response regulator transcription factor [Luteibacter aegosomaticola]|uniref:response regulator n=1 Tax=Luteibacter aegosomaticola TaxID=2911538 RepID=UPI001FF723F1|nr:response regulator transcription factor [Luteibacter aegosomaticola]UPG90727.1 response regulator transcription factor [Luteibacter aegosomaticola]